LSTRGIREFQIGDARKGRKKGTICFFGIPDPASVNFEEKCSGSITEQDSALKGCVDVVPLDFRVQ
jgi:hypothetical protein